MKRFLMVVAVALLGTTMFAGCAGKDVTVTTEDGEKVEVKMGSDGISVKTKDGEKNVDVKIDKEGIKVNTEDGKQVATVDKDGENAKVVVEGEDGETVVIESGENTADVDFPVYKDSKKMGGMQSSGGAGMNAGQAVSYETTDSVDDVFAFYKGKMKGASVVDMRTANDAALLNLDESDKTVSVAISKDESSGKTIFSITILKK